MSFLGVEPCGCNKPCDGLISRGFRILVQRPTASTEDPSRWNIEAEIKQSIELTIRREFTDELVRVATAGAGVIAGAYGLITKLTDNSVAASESEIELNAVESRVAAENRRNLEAEEKQAEPEPSSSGAGARKGGEPPQRIPVAVGTPVEQP